MFYENGKLSLIGSDLDKYNIITIRQSKTVMKFKKLLDMNVSLVVYKEQTPFPY